MIVNGFELRDDVIDAVRVGLRGKKFMFEAVKRRLNASGAVPTDNLKPCVKRLLRAWKAAGLIAYDGIYWYWTDEARV